jgi:hypothetical protein
VVSSRAADLDRPALLTTQVKAAEGEDAGGDPGLDGLLRRQVVPDQLEGHLHGRTGTKVDLGEVLRLLGRLPRRG